MNLLRPCLALVTDRRLVGGRLVKTVARAVEGGVDLVQLREKDLPAGDLLDLAKRLREVTAGRALLVVNDRVDVALGVGADGVHLPENGLPAVVVRRLIGARLLLGRAVHSVESAVAAGDVDYLQVGTIYATGSKPGVAPAGPGLVRAVAERTSIPLLAIGGIGPAQIREVIAAGASGVAVISAVLGAPDPKAAAAELRSRLVEALASLREANP